MRHTRMCHTRMCQPDVQRQYGAEQDAQPA